MSLFGDLVDLTADRTDWRRLSFSGHFGEHLDLTLGRVWSVEVRSSWVVVRRVVTVLFVGHFFLLARLLRPFGLGRLRFFPFLAAAAKAIIIIGSGPCGAAGGAPGVISGAAGPGGAPGGIIDGGCCIIASLL